MCSPPPHVNPPAPTFIDDSASEKVTQKQPAGHNPIVSGTPLLRNTVFPSPPPALSSREANRSSDPISPGGHSRSTGADESRCVTPHTGSGVTLENAPSDAGYDDSEFQALQNNLEDSGMLLLSMPPICNLYRWRFHSE